VLPGRTLAGDPDGYPTKDELADYLEQYAAGFSLPVVTGDGVIRLEREEAAFVAQTAVGGRVHAAAVIVAAGGFQLPIVPAFSVHLSPSVLQLDATTYQRPQQVPSGRVLIVGAGATGRQLARELAASHQVWLSSGRRRFILPQRVLGRDHLWWSGKSGGLRADKNTPLGRIARLLDAFPGMHLRDRPLRRLGIRVVPRTLDGRGAEFRFADGTSETFDTVIWTMGYHDDASWVAVSGAIGSEGKLLEERGVSPVPGLFYVGREWQNNRASGLICGVASDADKVVARLKLYLSGSVNGW
jgi:putative flavoprotein involved in K+ transport